MSIVELERLGDAEYADVSGQPVKGESGQVGGQHDPTSHTQAQVLSLHNNY